MLNPPNLTKLDWLTDTGFHAGLLLLNYALFGKDKLIRNYLISLAVCSFGLSYLLKKDQELTENV